MSIAPAKTCAANQQDSPAPSSTSNSPTLVNEKARLLAFVDRTAALPPAHQPAQHLAWHLSEGWHSREVHDEWRNHPCHLRIERGSTVRKEQAAQSKEHWYQLKLELAAKRRRIEDATA